ncbi:uncharacterized protein LOC129770108 isoform X2 [Toxorhynchites rutilus septentrionalis]|uniref:uncharacterized protein LOC129770108 isoform X2 n=1 Tax=Toxorhynchites rutilus septentrionalis TaxID=329112 RepID=UPI00247B1891|nr:uncharacterized protein LOC129770108 isoform X2 [Toxorhynchites rutilus septentrionalis]
MTRTCIVCGNRASKTDREIVDPLEKITYHTIPISEKRNRKWMVFCCLTKNDNMRNKYVCSVHFEKKCFERDLKSELLDGVKPIPTIKKPRKQKRKNSQEHEEEQQKRRKEEIEKLLNGDVPKPILNPFRQKQIDSKSSTKNEVRTSSRPRRKCIDAEIIAAPIEFIEPPIDSDNNEESESLRQENKILKLKITELEQQIEKKNEKISLAKTEMLNITIALQELKDIENRNLNIRVNEFLQGIFTDNQIRKLSHGGENITWTNDEMSNAFILRMFGEDTYEHVCDRLHYPLPTTTEMEQWVHDSYLQRGLLVPILKILQVYGRGMDPHDKECVLLLGRTKVRPQYTYDTIRDQIIDNEGYMHCICVQGILTGWHQIIYIDFDLIYSTDLLVILITELYKIEFNVMAVSGVCEQETVDLWSEFDISPDQHFIYHPKTEQPIYMFTCAVSTFQMLHKVLSDGGFLVQDDVLVTTNIIEKLFQSDLPEIHQNLKITKQHLSCRVFTEYNNHITEELISQATARSLQILSEEGEEAVAVLATLFELFRDWYDLSMTSSTCAENEISITHQKYGMNFDEQNVVLDGMYDTIESLKCNSEQYNFVQQAVMVSINSLRKLFIDIKRKFRGESIPTANLTMVSLNDLFSQYKQIQNLTVAPIEKILHLLSVVIADCDLLSITNKILNAASLNKGIRTLEKFGTSTDSTFGNISEKDACTFLTAYIAHELKEKYSYLGDQTFIIERKNNSYVVTSGIQTGDIAPSGLWVEQARKLEMYVSDITFYRNENVIENVVSSIAKRHPKMGVDIIRMYVEKRIMIKLNNLNKDLQQMS